MLLVLAACAPLHRPPGDAAAGVPGTALAADVAPATPATLAGDAGELVFLDDDALAALLANTGEAPLVVNFWATWCGPCVREMGVFRDVAVAVPSARFALVSVDAARDSARILPFLASHGVALPAYHLDVDDPSTSLARAVDGWPDLIPVTLVLDPGGAVRARFDGVVDAAALRAALAP